MQKTVKHLLKFKPRTCYPVAILDHFKNVLIFFRLPLNIQFKLLRDNVPKIGLFLYLGYTCGPRKYPPTLEQFLLEKDRNYDCPDLNMSLLSLDMTSPPTPWYRSEAHRQKYNKAVIDLMDCNFSEESYILMMLLFLFHQDTDDSDPGAKKAFSFFKELLYKYFMSTSGAMYGKHSVERYLQKLENVFKVEDLLFSNLCNNK